MDKKMENEMETGVIKGLYRDLRIQIIPTLGQKNCKCDLHWAIWSLGVGLRTRALGASGSNVRGPQERRGALTWS